MVKYKDKIIAYFDSCPDGVVAANELYEKEFSKMSEAAFFKALERLAKSGIIRSTGFTFKCTSIGALMT